MYRHVQKVFGHCDFLIYISYKTTFCSKHYSKVNSCLFLMKCLPTRAELNVVLHSKFSIILLSNNLRVQELSTKINFEHQVKNTRQKI